MRCARTMRWTGIPRAGGVRELDTETGRLGQQPPRSGPRAAGAAARLERERARLHEELGARRVVLDQLGARMRRAELRLATTRAHRGGRP